MIVSAAYLAIAVAAVLVALAGVHVYWAAGGRVGAAAAVPMGPDGTPVFVPGRGATLAVAMALVTAAVLVLGRAGVSPRIAPDLAYRWGAWALGAVFVLRAVGDFRFVGLSKRVVGTRFAALDTRVYTPLCAAIGAAVLYLAAL